MAVSDAFVFLRRGHPDWSARRELAPKPGAHASAAKPIRLTLQTLLLGSLASCAFWVWRMKGFRWYAGGLMALIELATFGAFFIAGMSVTGDWM